MAGHAVRISFALWLAGAVRISEVTAVRLTSDAGSFAGSTSASTNRANTSFPRLTQQRRSSSGTRSSSAASAEPVFGDREIKRISALVSKFDPVKADKAFRKLAKTNNGTAAACALANPSSGGNKGKTLLSLLGENYPTIPALPLPVKGDDKERLLQVIADGWGQKGSAMNHARVICGGGDGTGSWCLSTIGNLILKAGGASDGDDLDLAMAIVVGDRNFIKFLPIIVMFPLGTGNDLSRSIGWGSGFPQGEGRDEAAKEKSGLRKWMSTFNSSTEVTRFDVWRVQFSSGAKCEAKDEIVAGKIKAEGTFLMFLYMSTGWDAVAAAKFKRTAREGSLGQMINKGKHAKNSASQIPVLSNLRESGIRCPVGCALVDPQVTYGGNIGISNTPSMYSGGFPWGHPQGKDGYKDARVFDKLVEITKSNGPVHGGVTSQAVKASTGPIIKTNEPRVGQAEKVIITFEARKERFFQYDGEGGIQCDGAGAVKVTHGGQLRMLVGPFRKPYFTRACESSRDEPS